MKLETHKNKILNMELISKVRQRKITGALSKKGN